MYATLHSVSVCVFLTYASNDEVWQEILCIPSLANALYRLYLS